MRAINLLPRKTFWEAWFVPLLVAVLVLYALIGMVLYWTAWSAEAAHRRNEKELAALQEQIRILREDRVPDPAMVRFEQFQGVVAALEEKRYDWMPALEAIVSPLPSAARVPQASYLPETAAIELSSEFKSLRDAAAFVTSLRAVPLLRNVFVTGIDIAEASPLPAEQPGDGASENARELEFVTTTDDPALRELEWMIFRQAAAQNGIELPAEPPAARPAEYPGLGEAFTREEIEAARDTVFGSRPQPQPIEESENDLALPYYIVQLSIDVAGLEPSGDAEEEE